MLVFPNYAKNYSSTIYKCLFPKIDNISTNGDVKTGMAVINPTPTDY